MNIIIMLLIGALAGWIAGELMRGRGFGLIGDIIVGVVGALVGGLVFRILGLDTYGYLGTLLMAVLGAAVFLSLISLVRRTT